MFKSCCECRCLYDPDSSVQSVISFDQGGEWVPLRKPANSKCDATAKDPDKVNKERKPVRLDRKQRLIHDENYVRLEVIAPDCLLFNDIYNELSLGLQGCDLGLSPLTSWLLYYKYIYIQNAACVHSYSAVSTSTQHTVLP